MQGTKHRQAEGQWKVQSRLVAGRRHTVQQAGDKEEAWKPGSPVDKGKAGKPGWLVAGVTPKPARRLLEDLQADLHAAGASVHDAGHLPRLAVQVEVQIQIQGVPEDIDADAPAGQGFSRLASSPWHLT